MGGAIGDAMGMPASFSHCERRSKSYGYIHDFLEPEKDVQSYHGNLQAAEITDDTMESVIISDILIADGEFTEMAFNRAMKKWAVEQKMLESTVIGPSTRRYLTALIEGRDPKETSGQGNTNGSAMRAAPIGVKYHYDLGKCMESGSRLVSSESRQQTGCGCGLCGSCCGSGRSGRRIFSGRGARCSVRCGGVRREARAEITAPSVSKRIRMAEYIVDAGDRHPKYH